MKREMICKGKLTLLFLFCALFCTAASEKKGERLLICGCSWDKIAIVDKGSGQIVWSHPVLPGEDCNDIERTRHGEILYAYRSGARLIREDHNVVWDFKAPENSELYSATELPNGHFMLAMCGKPAQITILNQKGEVVRHIRFDPAIEQIHDQFRQIVRSNRGTFLIPLMGTGEVAEMDREGKIIRKVFVGGNLFSIKELKNGNWIAGCGDAHCFIEMNPETGVVIRKTDNDAIQGVTLLFVAETIRLDNGNTLVCNWCGHSNDKTQPRLVEFDTDNKVVWTLNNPEIKDISAIFVDR